jgi:hypothetical protein
MYSSQDTPPHFKDIVAPYVTSVVPYNDNLLTFNIDYASAYSSFNTLRTCNFMHAYKLKYQKVCIIESDLVIMGNMDGIFELQAPAILYYGALNSPSGLNANTPYVSDANDLFRSCATTSTMNGGVLLIEPSPQKYQEYVNALPLIIKNNCKYPNEALFEYVNRGGFFNLPIKYNLSHYHSLRLQKFGVGVEDILVYHFNETDYKHLDIVKDKWLEKNRVNQGIMRKYSVKKIPIFYFRDEIYLPNRAQIDGLLGISDTNSETVNVDKGEVDKAVIDNVNENVVDNIATDIHICLEPELKAVVSKSYYISRGGRRKKSKKNSVSIHKKIGRVGGRITCKKKKIKGTRRGKARK